MTMRGLLARTIRGFCKDSIRSSSNDNLRSYSQEEFKGASYKDSLTMFLIMAGVGLLDGLGTTCKEI
jgi:hypothetical protein